ncbi:MAG TPA: C4-type zinc ribbon domain-containing protein [Acidimicrobiia bacterium]
MTGLESLLAVQERDLTLDRLRHQRATLPERERVAGVGARLEALDVTRAARGAARDELAGQEQRLADEAQRLGEQGQAAEKRLYSGEVASPRELQALQTDVEQLRRRQRTVEDQQLGVMELREPIDQELGVLDEERAALEADRAATQGELDVKERELDGAIASEQIARDEAAGTVERSLVAEYERRRDHAGGVGVARLVGSTCQGCHLTIPATAVDRLRREREGELAYCDNCGCILVP